MSGRVWNQLGQPVSQARVLIQPSREIGSGRSQVSLHFEITDASGRWRCSHFGGPEESMSLQIFHPNYAPVRFRLTGQQIAGGAGDRFSEPWDALMKGTFTVLLQPGITLKGRVLDPSGKPVQGAKISAGNEVVWTPVSGRFFMNQFLPGKRDFLVTAKGCAPKRGNFSVYEGMPDLVFVLERGHLIQTRVTGTQGDPLPGVEIRATRWLDRAPEDWVWLTDVDGEFVWDSAPSEDVFFSLKKEGYLPLEEILIRGKLERITLRKPLTIIGEARDAVTGNLLPEFRVTPGWFHHDHFHWDRGRTEVARGNFRVVFSRKPEEQGILIEAEGYYPAESKPFPENDEEQFLRFELERGEPLAGRILLPNGQPAIAEVAFMTAARGVVLGRGGFADHDRGHITKTDQQGYFQFQPARNARKLAAVSDAGFAALDMDLFHLEPVLVLQPWGRIRGQLSPRDFAGGNRLVGLAALGSGLILHSHHYSAVVDARGNFEMERIPPGDFVIGRLVQSQLSHGQAIELAPDQVLHITLGSGGRRIHGEVLGERPQELDWDSWNHPAFLRRKIPPLDPPEFPNAAARNDWFWDFGNSRAGKTRRAGEMPYLFEVQRGGAFEVENVPAGVYELEIHYHEPGEIGTKDRCLGKVKREVTIEDGSGGLDLGILRMLPGQSHETNREHD
jgi:hypothetical protein